MVLLDSRRVKRRGLLVANRRELGLARLELDAGALKLCLLGCDLVARRADLADQVLGLVAKIADPVHDARVLVLDAVEVVVAVDQVVEAVGFEDHRERVGLIRLVDLDEAAGKDLERAVQPVAKGVKSRRLGLEPRLGLGELLGDDGLAIAKRRDLACELVDLLGVLGELGREDAFLRPDLLELGLLRAALLFERLAKGGPPGKGDAGRGCSQQ